MLEQVRNSVTSPHTPDKQLGPFLRNACGCHIERFCAFAARQLTGYGGVFEGGFCHTDDHNLLFQHFPKVHAQAGFPFRAQVDKPVNDDAIQFCIDMGEEFSNTGQFPTKKVTRHVIVRNPAGDEILPQDFFVGPVMEQDAGDNRLLVVVINVYSKDQMIGSPEYDKFV